MAADIKMTPTRVFKYGNRSMRPGVEFSVKSEREARLLEALRRARRVTAPPAVVAPPPVPEAPAPAPAPARKRSKKAAAAETDAPPAEADVIESVADHEWSAPAPNAGGEPFFNPPMED